MQVALSGYPGALSRRSAGSACPTCCSLLQQWAKQMETGDHVRVFLTLYPSLLDMASGPACQQGLSYAIATSDVGGLSQANLDLSAPLGELAPKSRAEMRLCAIAERWELRQD